MEMTLQENSPLVLKFGGASFVSLEDFTSVALSIKRIKEEVKRPLIIVVSAMKSQTDSFMKMAYQLHATPPERELDMLVSVGERISMSMLAMALDNIGEKAISFTGSQSGIITCTSHAKAKIIDVKPWRVVEALSANAIVVIAGFQGVSTAKEITTLGRGGSDTTAVAIACSLGSPHVVFFKDVGAIYEEDPKLNPASRKIPFLSYEETLKIVQNPQFHSILHPRSVLLAQKNGIPLYVRGLLKDNEGSWVGVKTRTPQQTPIFETELQLY